MPRFACPACKGVITATEDQRGAVLACPACDKKIRVPQAKAAASQAAGPDGVEKPPKPAEAAPRKAPPPLPKAARDEDESHPPGAKSSHLPAHDDEDDEAPPRKKRRRDPEEDDLGDEETGVDKPHPQRKVGGGVLATVGGVFGGLGALLFLTLFILIISGRGPRWLMDFIQEKLEANGIPPLVAIGVAAAVFLIPVGLWFLVMTKSSILDAMPDEVDFKPTKLSNFPELDTDELDRLTRLFEELGFEKLQDYTVISSMSGSGFGRLLANRDDGCYAEINQVFTADGRAVPMRCMIASHMDDGWSLLTTSRTPSKEGYLMRRPRAPWRSLPDKEPEDLLTHHLKMRKKMLKAIGVELETDLSERKYFTREKAANRERKEVVRRRWSLGILLEFHFFERNPKYEWLGEYAG